MATAVLYLRVPQRIADEIRAISEETGLSITAVASALIDRGLSDRNDDPIERALRARRAKRESTP